MSFWEALTNGQMILFKALNAGPGASRFGAFPALLYSCFDLFCLAVPLSSILVQEYLLWVIAC